MIIRLLLLAITLQSLTLFAQNFNRPVPPGVFPYEFREYSNGFNGFLLLTPFHIVKRQGHPEHVPAEARSRNWQRPGG